MYVTRFQCHLPGTHLLNFCSCFAGTLTRSRAVKPNDTIYVRFYSDDYDIIKWKYFPRCWPFVRGINRSLVVPSQRPMMSSYDVIFDLRLNKQFSEKSKPREFEMSRVHYNLTEMLGIETLSEHLP